MIITGIVICIVMAGFFAGLETGLLAADQLSLFIKKEKKLLYARAAHYLLIKPERLLSTTLIGTNIAVVSATVLLKSLFLRMGYPLWLSWPGSLLLSIVLLVFSEIIPKSFFRQHADGLSVRIAPLLTVFYILFIPLSFFLNRIVAFMLFVFRQRSVKRLPRSREDLRLLMKLICRESGMQITGQKIIDDIFDFKETMAREVMVPFHEVPVCSRGSSIREIIMFYTERKSRFIPVFLERADNVVGIIDMDTALTVQATSINDIMKKAIYYPETKKIPDLLKAMIEKNEEVVFLVDEYGGISGMISKNDIAAEIVGYIPEEHRSQAIDISIISRNVVHVSGTTDLEDLFRETGIRIEKGNYDTVGGYICFKTGEIPRAGTAFTDKGLGFSILESDERRIKRIEIRRIKKEEL
ncbi:MAG: HlyC/CorC family transporter [Spirochaetales bacterium]|nr:HlyC/CorC family transporter [Spirochaetales bacterium]